MFCAYVTEALYLSLHCLCAARLCYTCFDCGGIYPDFIDPVPGRALPYLCAELILTWQKIIKVLKYKEQAQVWRNQKPFLVAEKSSRRLKQNTKNTKKHVYSELTRCLLKLY